MKKKGFIAGVLLGLVGACIGLGCGQALAADVEIILGESSGFNVVRGTSVAAGTSILYVGSSTGAFPIFCKKAYYLCRMGHSEQTHQ